MSTTTISRLRSLLQPKNISRFISSSSSSSVEKSSLIYQQTLKTQRPLTIQFQKKLLNSVSFIGTIISPIKSYTREGGALVAHTQLKVQSPDGPNKFLTIFLDMWDDMAELSIQHIKPNDCIYVSGYLRSSTITCDDGSTKLKNKVIVKEINYVANNNQQCQNIEDQRESALERQRKRLYLWQVFFANPYEWKDLRKCKANPREPDFRHKGSGEALWLNPHDPPWVKRQLELQDSRMCSMGSHSFASDEPFKSFASVL
uniref:protein OSB1, mitochondrial-like n=1 Tax=Erigeron canadensis TaxID=72917 RepID=UPI001CB98828|nr:protein OSB1, mitochondrial-like [Erigeron canadensis]